MINSKTLSGRNNAIIFLRNVCLSAEDDHGDVQLRYVDSWFVISYPASAEYFIFAVANETLTCIPQLQGADLVGEVSPDGAGHARWGSGCGAASQRALQPPEQRASLVLHRRAPRGVCPSTFKHWLSKFECSFCSLAFFISSQSLQWNSQFLF